MTFLDLHIDWDRISRQKNAYNELSNFKEGDSGLMAYYPISAEEHNKWFEEQKKNKPEKKDIKS